MEIIMQVCKGCGEEKPLSAFYKRRLGKDKKCKVCYSSVGPESRFSSSWYKERFSQDELELFSVLKNLCTKAKLRTKDFDPSIDWKHLFDIWESQNGLCAYSGVPLSLEVNHPHKISLDRIDSSVGYCVGNLQLVTFIVNKMKQEFDEDLFLDTCRQIVDYSETTR